MLRKVGIEILDFRLNSFFFTIIVFYKMENFEETEACLTLNY